MPADAEGVNKELKHGFSRSMQLVMQYRMLSGRIAVLSKEIASSIENRQRILRRIETRLAQGRDKIGDAAAD